MKTTLLYRRLLSICWLLTLLSGCGKKEPDPVPVPTTGIAGTVNVASQRGVALPKGGVTVTVLNTTPVRTTTTTEAGTFALGAVPAGTYTLVFTRPGLSTFVLRGVAHPNSNALTRLPETYRLLQEPDLRITSLQATNYTPPGGTRPTGVTFRVGRTSPQPSENGSYVLYFSTTPDVGFLTSTSSMQSIGGTSPAVASYTTESERDRDDFVRYGFNVPSGTAVYAVAYGMDVATGYTDLVTGRLLFWPHPNLTPSPVVSFTMP